MRPGCGTSLVVGGLEIKRILPAFATSVCNFRHEICRREPARQIASPRDPATCTLACAAPGRCVSQCAHLSQRLHGRGKHACPVPRTQNDQRGGLTAAKSGELLPHRTVIAGCKVADGRLRASDPRLDLALQPACTSHSLACASLTRSEVTSKLREHRALSFAQTLTRPNHAIYISTCRHQTTIQLLTN